MCLGIRLEARRLGIAVGATAAALLLRSVIHPLVGPAYPHVTFLPAVMVAAWSGGLLPGLVACVLSALSAAFLLDASTDSVVELVLAGALMSVLGELLRRSWKREQRQGEELAHLRARTNDAHGPAAPSHSTALRILVVEDNDNAAESLALLLSVHGHEVRIARDGHSALAEAELWRPEVAFLDIGLPGGLDGHETARRLRANNRSLRLVALTGCTEEEDRRKALEAGFDVYLVKPAGMDDISRALHGP